MDKPQDKRQNGRLTINIDAIIHYQEQTILTQIRDIGMGGMYVYSECTIEPYNTVDITISLPGKTFSLPMNFKGTIIRRESNGMAIRFHEFDNNAYNHLKSAVSLFYDTP